MDQRDAGAKISGCSKGSNRKFWPKVTHPLLIWVLESFDRKLRPDGYR